MGPGRSRGTPKSSSHSATTIELPISHHSSVMGLQGHHGYPPMEHTEPLLHSQNKHGHHRLLVLPSKVHMFGCHDFCVGDQKVSGQTFPPSVSHDCQLMFFTGHSSLSLVQTLPPTITHSGQVLVRASNVKPMGVVMIREVLDSLRKVQRLLALLGRSESEGSFPQELCLDLWREVMTVGFGDPMFGATFARAAIKQAGCVNRVVRAGGGVGDIATQLLAKQFQYEVAVATGEAYPDVSSQGVSRVLYYTAGAYLTQLVSLPQLKLVLDYARRRLRVAIVKQDYSGQMNGWCLSPGQDRPRRFPDHHSGHHLLFSQDELLHTARAQLAQ